MCAQAGPPPSTGGWHGAHRPACAPPPVHQRATGLTQFSTGFSKTTFQPAGWKSHSTNKKGMILKFLVLESHSQKSALSNFKTEAILGPRSQANRIRWVVTCIEASYFDLPDPLPLWYGGLLSPPSSLSTNVSRIGSPLAKDLETVPQVDQL